MAADDQALASERKTEAYPLGPRVLAHVRNADDAPWRVLLVDNEADIHLSTEMSMRAARLDGLPIVFERADSADSARAMLRANSYALALLDIVMETQHAGLELVRWVRAEADDPLVRLVVRTGQPGAAPELTVLRDYDIVDYRGKSLMASQVATMIRGQVRNYRDVRSLARRTWVLDKLTAAYESFIADRNTVDRIWSDLVSGASGLCAAAPRSVRFLEAHEPEHAARIAHALAGNGLHIDDAGTTVACSAGGDPAAMLFEATVPVNEAAASALKRAVAALGTAGGGR